MSGKWDISATWRPETRLEQLVEKVQNLKCLLREAQRGRADAEEHLAGKERVLVSWQAMLDHLHSENERLVEKLKALENKLAAKKTKRKAKK